MKTAQSNASMTVNLDVSDSNRLARLAALKKQSPQTVLNQAVHDYLLQEEARQAFINEAKTSWENVAKTGQHISLEEFADWVDTVQNQPDAPMPTCHKSY
ncbi:MAG: hypothetical protein PHH59_09995 [Methylovulum sp.]|uniref:CopG family ribbon-helix-helix protein n=1 Tax=Methylovulum sp. TaxID=1916980 RepID=UPI00263463EA|nr:hypothetical protein [Methylovulum sp.]MDD2724337.1 hypothetical protein [Methylovulum sp.]MDD5124933.1 hypothetical protein [Methylovulum sp.]